MHVVSSKYFETVQEAISIAQKIFVPIFWPLLMSIYKITNKIRNIFKAFGTKKQAMDLQSLVAVALKPHRTTSSRVVPAKFPKTVSQPEFATRIKLE